MQRQVSTPMGLPKNGAHVLGVPKIGRRVLGVPKQANVISLSKWKSANGGEPPEQPPTRDTIKITLPAGARPDDEFQATTLTEQIHEELRAGDILIIYETSDVEKDDLVAIESAEGTTRGYLMRTSVTTISWSGRIMRNVSFTAQQVESSGERLRFFATDGM